MDEKLVPQPSAPPLGTMNPLKAGVEPSAPPMQAYAYEDRVASPVPYSSASSPAQYAIPIADHQTRFSTSVCSAMARGLCAENHIFCIILTLIVYILILASIIEGVKHSECVASTDDFNANFCPIAGFIVSLFLLFFFYVMSLVESFRSPTFKFLYSFGSVEVSNYINQMRSARPNLQETAHCFHTETRSSTSTDSNGNTTTSTETVTVTTHTVSVNFPFDDVDDVTDNIPALEEYQICRLYCRMCWVPGNPVVQQRYDTFKAQFQSQHMHCDSQRTFFSSVVVPGFKEHLATVAEGTEVPFALRNGYTLYVIMSILGSSLWYRLWFCGISGRQDITFTKRIIQ